MNEILEYSINLDTELRNVCESLFDYICKKLINSECKLYHGSPVWFIRENPIVGYSKKGNEIAVLFWSGQSFTEKDLSVLVSLKLQKLLMLI